jgi:hypothetical protein
MPPISVRDIQIKDDKFNSDLVAGTHGRGFWILDDIMPLRQAAEAASAQKAYLVKPANAVRVRFDTNDPTPWPPELPAGENPPNGAVLDYYLPSAANEVKLEILDGQRNVIRTYQSSNVPPGPHPATDPEAYNKICQQNPSAPDCGLPLYWPAPPRILKASAGMHRFLWDMHYDAVPGTVGGRRGGDDEGGAVPHRTAPEIDAPWAVPGQYSVRLSVDGQSQSEPLLVLLDPRVKVTPEAEVIFTMTKQVEDAARRAAKARSEAEAMIAKLQGATSTATSQAQLKSLQELVSADATASGTQSTESTFLLRATPPTSPANLANISGRLVTSVMGFQGSELPPTAVQIAACRKQLAVYTALMTRWTALRAGL